MIRIPTLAVLAALLAAPAAARTLVFCSEGNPESLNPQLVTTTTGMDATWPLYNTLVEFAPARPRSARRSPNPGRSRRTGATTSSACARASPSTAAPASGRPGR